MIAHLRRFNDEIGLSPGRRLIQQRVARARVSPQTYRRTFKAAAR